MCCSCMTWSSNSRGSRQVGYVYSYDTFMSLSNLTPGNDQRLLSPLRLFLIIGSNGGHPIDGCRPTVFPKSWTALAVGKLGVCGNIFVIKKMKKSEGQCMLLVTAFL